jgi:hypothetical protein
MNFKKFKASNSTLVYIIIALVILIIFLFFGGDEWLQGSQLNRSIGYSHWNWTQILISLGLGIVIGWFIHKRRR